MKYFLALASSVVMVFAAGKEALAGSWRSMPKRLAAPKVKMDEDPFRKSAEASHYVRSRIEKIDRRQSQTALNRDWEK